MKIKSPCRECEDRTAQCHAECEKYKNYVEANRADNLFRRKQAKYDEIHSDYKAELHRKRARKK